LGAVGLLPISSNLLHIDQPTWALISAVMNCSSAPTFRLSLEQMHSGMPCAVPRQVEVSPGVSMSLHNPHIFELQLKSVHLRNSDAVMTSGFAFDEEEGGNLMLL
jgi:hypothetical protein